MPRFVVFSVALLAVDCAAFGQTSADSTVPAAQISPTYLSSTPAAIFPVAPHNDVTIEWWYLNANLHTSSGRHLALIGSFFRFGNASGMIAKDSKIKAQQSHYLIYAITDIDTKKHYTYSFGDRNTLELLQQATTMALEANPDNARLANLVSLLDQGQFPAPTRLIGRPCVVQSMPFSASYGPFNSVAAVAGAQNTFALRLGGAGNAMANLTFTGLKTPMLVNGNGNTGLRVRSDMKYVSLTRDRVEGTVDTGSGAQQATGEGWFDHQWGNSWTTQSAGWDWWGVQLANGTDILFFRQLNLKTGKPFFPCATFEDSSGYQVTTHNIQFKTDVSSIWKSPTPGVSYPLKWTVTFPDQHVTLNISPYMSDQEMPVLANGGAIWEGACPVDSYVNGVSVPGVAYMELVGYNSPAIRASLSSPTSN